MPGQAWSSAASMTWVCASPYNALWPCRCVQDPEQACMRWLKACHKLPSGLLALLSVLWQTVQLLWRSSGELDQ